MQNWIFIGKATVNEIHVSGHPPARNFNCRINWSLLVTLRHYWSSDLDSVPRARAAVLPVCVSSLPFTVDNVSAQFLCVLHFSKNSFPMEDSRMSTSYFYLQAVL